MIQIQNKPWWIDVIGEDGLECWEFLISIADKFDTEDFDKSFNTALEHLKIKHSGLKYKRTKFTKQQISNNLVRTLCMVKENESNKN